MNNVARAICRGLVLGSFGALLLGLRPAWGVAGEATVAVAANFAGTLEQLVEAYQKQSGDRIVIVGGSTGKLAAQIAAGAPFDILLAADDHTIGKLIQNGSAIGASEFTYAIGKLALWSADPRRIGENGEQVLKSGRFRRLAYANPRLAPYGAAAEAVLAALGLAAALKGKVVMGENVGQVFSMAATGSAELAFVAFAQVTGSAEGRSGSAWIVPDDLYPPIRQNGALLARARENPAARAFLDFLASAPAVTIIGEAGYETAEK